jgi:hypothetical protein
MVFQHLLICKEIAMKSFANKTLAMLLMALGLTAAASIAAVAQKPVGGEQLKWSVISSGGIVNSSGSGYKVSATVGQPSVGRLEGGGKKFDLGFWARVVLQDAANGVDDPNLQPEMTILSNYPNPFVGNTTIHYNLPGSGNVTLKIYDVAGRLVRVLVDEFQDGGSRNVSWNGKDDADGELSAGSYTYELVMLGTSGNLRQRQQMMLVK